MLAILCLLVLLAPFPEKETLLFIASVEFHWMVCDQETFDSAGEGASIQSGSLSVYECLQTGNIYTIDF
jgi:hypothetical protein